jgi:cyclopropane fatty-acyl-phospholipid synthase-like methyltransferase
VRRLKSLARRLIDGCAERYLNIRTSGCRGDRSVGQGYFGDGRHYEPLDYPLLVRCLKALDLNAEDTVFEIGCGMGRVVCLLARRRVRRCVGIELSEELAERARANVASVRGRRSPVEILAADAAFADYSDGTAFYLFNSFGPRTLAAVLERIRSTLDRDPRRVRFVYVNPFHDDVFEAAGWLRYAGAVRSRWFKTHASCWVAK